jgi:sugar/nucleoside kinase (ribokinase family)
MLDNFKKQKVATDLVKIDNRNKTGFSFILIGPGNEHIIFTYRGAGSDLKISNFDLRKLKNSEWVYLTTITGEWAKALDKIFSLKNKKSKIAWNIGGEQLKAGAGKLKKYIKQADVFCLNKDEATELVYSEAKYKNKTKKYFNNTRNLLRAIKSWGPGIVVITKGKQGVDVYDGECFYHQNIIKAKNQIDTTGVGDAFNSSFVAGLKMYSGDIKKSMRLGLKNAASVVGQTGAQNGLILKKNI